ncbi:hypothetical protein DFH06DRAFT_1208451 [Mycena polygramma]|nr:hypothetical protein DFH06DRAFT_1208451 [Mycena polygramma]
MDYDHNGPVDAFSTQSIPTGCSNESLRTRLAEIDAEIGDLYARLDSLSVSREHISDALKTIVYPVLTIPSEITSDIFQHCVSDTIGIKQSLALASVCRAWRHIALDLRSLWANLCIPISSRPLFGGRTGLDCWVMRAGCHPLNVDTTATTDDFEAPTCDHLFDALGPYSTQTRTLTCSVMLPHTNHTDARIPLLRALNIDLCSTMGVTWQIQSFAEAPNLREVSLSTSMCISMPEHMELPWRQLTHLTCSGWYIGMCTEIISLTPHLETFACLNRDEPCYLQPTSVRLDHLHTLQALDHAECNILDYLNLSSLRSLSLLYSVGDYPHRRCEPHLVPFLSRSGCTLRSISIGGTVVLPWEYVMATLEAVPTVSQVSIANLNTDWDRLFTRIHSDSSFLPNLQILSIESTEPQFSVDAIIDEMTQMLMSRWHRPGGSQRLESLRLVRPRPLGFSLSRCPRTVQAEHSINTLRKLTAEGCKIDIRGFEQDLNPSRL